MVAAPNDRHDAPRRRDGFTLIEVLISLTMLLVVVASVTSVYRTQIRAIDSATGRLEAIRNLRFVQSTIDRELRLAGGVGGQPVIVMAHPMALTFNVDLVTRNANDHSAVYYNPDADSLATEGFDPARAKALPLVAKVYPAQAYTDAGGNRSTAETIAYFLVRDLTATRSDIYTMFRRVNDRDSTVVARNIQVPTDSVYFFRYWRTDVTGNLSQIPLANLPIYWDAASRLADSIRVVDLRVNTFYHDAARNIDVLRSTSTSTKLLNAGTLGQSTCGGPPLPARNVNANLVLDANGAPSSVHVTWDASQEETAGEKDVALYLVQRRLSAATAWETLYNVPANGSASYSFDDHNLATGTWLYAIVAQDCSPANSAPVLSMSIVIP